MYASHADLFKEAEEPDWVTAWLSKREEKAEKKDHSAVLAEIHLGLTDQKE